MSIKSMSRRHFLQGALGTASLLFLAACAPPEEKTATPGPFDALQNGQGAILELDGRQVAVYKDNGGQVLKFSPKCTHKGCDITWNQGSSTWDCPCHGSKFKADGSVANGPATEPLEKV